MKIETTRFGMIEIDDDKIINMPAGMLGFQGNKNFVILEREESLPFYWYHSVDDPKLAFVIINPFLFKPDYDVDIRPAFKDMNWDQKKMDSIKIYVVVNASNGSPENFTANLIGPLLINTNRYEAVQMVLYDSSYSHKHLIFK